MKNADVLHLSAIGLLYLRVRHGSATSQTTPRGGEGHQPIRAGENPYRFTNDLGLKS